MVFELEALVVPGSEMAYDIDKGGVGTWSTPRLARQGGVLRQFGIEPDKAWRRELVAAAHLFHRRRTAHAFDGKVRRSALRCHPQEGARTVTFLLPDVTGTEGPATQHFPDGGRIEGNIKGGWFEGPATKHFPDGGKIVGEITKDGKFELLKRCP